MVVLTSCYLLYQDESYVDIHVLSHGVCYGAGLAVTVGIHLKVVEFVVLAFHCYVVSARATDVANVADAVVKAGCHCNSCHGL